MEDYWVFTPTISNSEEPTTYLKGFELRRSGKDTAAQELATMPDLPTVTTPSQSSLIMITLPGRKYGEIGLTTSGLYLESQQTIYS